MLEPLARAYYAAIDGNDVDAALSRFSSAATYERPGYPPFIGLQMIRRFYETGRVIAAGHHRLRLVVEAGRVVAVEGDFDARLSDGRQLSGGFADVWIFDQEEYVVQRRTYFFVPLV